MRKENRYPYGMGEHTSAGYDIYGRSSNEISGKTGEGRKPDDSIHDGINDYFNDDASDDINDGIMIDDLNDLAVQLQWAKQNGEELPGRSNGRRNRRARKNRAGRDRIQNDTGQTGVRTGRDRTRRESLPADRGLRNAAESGAVTRVTLKNRRRRRRRTLFSAFLCLLALAALTGCFVLAAENRKLQDEVQVAMAYVDEVNSVTTYTEEQVRKMTADAAAEAAERSSVEKEKEILDDIRTRMESGDGTAPMLRAVYKDELVVADDGRYYFFPVVDTLKHHSYQADQFQMNEEEVLEYFADGKVVSKKGIDVSRYQGDIDWKKVAGDGVEYAFIRLGIRGSSEGKLVLDSTYEENMEEALKNDVAVGVYFFTQALNKEEAVEEAEYVLEHLEGYDVTYPVVLDVEEVTGDAQRTEGMTQQERTDACIAFCDRIREAGYTPMIYGNLKTFLLMLDMGQLEEYEKWFAFYQTPLYFPYEFSIWQYTSTGSVDGIKGDVDMNVCMKDWGSE